VHLNNEPFEDSISNGSIEREYTESFTGIDTTGVIGAEIRAVDRLNNSRLKKFFIGGQWVWPAGGIPGVARVSRHIAQIICKEDGREFLKK